MECSWLHIHIWSRTMKHLASALSRERKSLWGGEEWWGQCKSIKMKKKKIPLQEFREECPLAICCLQCSAQDLSHESTYSLLLITFLEHFLPPDYFYSILNIICNFNFSSFYQTMGHPVPWVASSDKHSLHAWMEKKYNINSLWWLNQSILCL
jgi:hypothetical protein